MNTHGSMQIVVAACVLAGSVPLLSRQQAHAGLARLTEEFTERSGPGF